MGSVHVRCLLGKSKHPLEQDTTQSLPHIQDIPSDAHQGPEVSTSVLCTALKLIKLTMTLELSQEIP